MPRKHLVLAFFRCPNLFLVLATKLVTVLFQDAVRSGHRRYVNISGRLKRTP